MRIKSSNGCEKSNNRPGTKYTFINQFNNCSIVREEKNQTDLASGNLVVISWPRNENQAKSALTDPIF